MTNQIQSEISRRLEMWSTLTRAVDANNVPPKLLRDLNFFSGQAGIYRDIKRTKQCTVDGAGIALSLLHTGRHYPDDLSDTEIIYHYPETSRIGNTDQNEIQSAKNASKFDVPVFVISMHGTNRKVQLAKITSWDDTTKTFLVLFKTDQPMFMTYDENTDDTPFVLKSDPKHIQGTTVVKSRPGQPSFKFNVFKRYGAVCAVCDIRLPNLLQAAHIVPKKYQGSDDPRNGLVLCANHHLAFDSGLLKINPETTAIEVTPKYTASMMGITRSNLNHLPNQPHPDALKWRETEGAK
ncbi:HNH endonuclease [Paenibacillus sp. FSL W8-0919]|uniref:HNH endonuclease n=1 Tax=Paenibacillus sp. FSL W8-0919 TaxID=2954707 RepID=UPI0030F6DA39